MKKIFMASICAIMAVTAANADIASTSYVDTAVKDLETTQNKATAITQGMDKSAMYPTVKLTEELIGISNQDMSDLIGDVADNTTVMAEVAKKVSVAQGDEAKQKLMNTNDKGNVVAAGIVGGDVVDGNYVTGLAVNADGELVVSKGEIDVGGDIDAAIAELDATVSATVNHVVTAVVEEDGKLTSVDSTQITDAYVANDAGIAQSKIAGLVNDLSAKLDKSALEEAETKNDGVYTLTMKKEGTTITYYWEQIGR